MTDAVQEPGVVPAEVARACSGLDFMAKIMSGEFPPPPIAVLMNFRPVEVSEGYAVFEGAPGFAHYNPLGAVHGGYAMTLIDTVTGCAVHTKLPAGVGYTTLETKVNMIRPITVDTGLVRAEGTAVHVGRRTGVAEGRILDKEGRVLAFGTTTCAVLAG